MKLTATTALLALIGSATARKDKPDQRTFAVLRFTNKQLVKTRADPIISPGVAGSHVHTVMGGSGFGLSSTGKDLMASNCSNAMVKGDNSNYWFPSLYFKDPQTGKLEDVELFYANAYYFFEPTNDDIKSFPVGLSIVVGDPNVRTPPKDGASSNLDPSKGPVNPIKWTCPRQNMDIKAYPDNSDGLMAGIADKNNKGEGVGFPDVECDAYGSPLRGDVHFPSCYNPAAGLKNYKENMVFPSDAGDGKQDCPKGYIHVPHLFLEVYWNTLAFKDRWQKGQGTQPFVLSNGDATGYSNHADFMAGWDEDLLQGIIDHCDKGTSGMDQCTGQLKYGLNKGDCTIAPLVDETVNGVLSALPGKNAITGWQYGGSGSAGASGGDNTPPPVNSKASGSDDKPKPSSTQPSTQPTGDDASSVSSNTKLPGVVNVGVNKPANSEETSTTVAAAAKETADDSSAPLALSTGASSCVPKIHTVWETVTVTAEAPEHTNKRRAHEHALRHRNKRH
ncbi:hypothetical protein QQS21_012594 [Conoideocrella luteorostrata]|uniref:DUF1996 domain-containing protein n=1 Tax=Conoideocrella luteorostrata TaxID=1105319 RepID=A0AAJ0CC10_9HYPO|nr:hypothetical protein QQS21_012594 [Conoideocrella luteorostrata]